MDGDKFDNDLNDYFHTVFKGEFEHYHKLRQISGPSVASPSIPQ